MAFDPQLQAQFVVVCFASAAMARSAPTTSLHSTSDEKPIEVRGSEADEMTDLVVRDSALRYKAAHIAQADVQVSRRLLNGEGRLDRIHLRPFLLAGEVGSVLARGERTPAPRPLSIVR
jgi:hypothetical protein